jgi:hypothetical protein
MCKIEQLHSLPAAPIPEMQEVIYSEFLGLKAVYLAKLISLQTGEEAYALLVLSSNPKIGNFPIKMACIVEPWLDSIGLKAKVTTCVIPPGGHWCDIRRNSLKIIDDDVF